MLSVHVGDDAIHSIALAYKVPVILQLYKYSTGSDEITSSALNACATSFAEESGQAASWGKNPSAELGQERRACS